MRPIDADALVFSRVRIAHEDGTIGGYNAVVMSAEINNAPTIETIPIRKGEWVHTGKSNIYGGISLRCPFCGDEVMVSRIEDEIYCRHCGAKLGKEE